MKILITYSSSTGNTKKVAEEIYNTHKEATFLPISEVKSTDEYDLIIMGGWIDRGIFNEEAANFARSLKEKKVAFFFTIGAFPTARHGVDSANNIKDLLAEGNNKIINHFHCQGRIAPYLIASFLEHGKGKPGYEETKLRYEYADKHPNAEDMMAARYFMTRTLTIMKEGNNNDWT